MRAFLKFLVVVLLLGAIGFGAYSKGIEYLKKRNLPSYRTERVTDGEIKITVRTSGEVKPVLSVQVGSFVSGPIQELLVDYNDKVEQGQVLARIDPRIYQASYDRDLAALNTRKAEVKRSEAELQRAKNDEMRALALRKENAKFISQAELDQRRFARAALEATLEIAKAAVRQAEANLKNSEANLGYTDITSPVAGIVIDRLIQPGQTLAAQFQTPELFVIAPDIREKMHIEASVSEADMGLIREAYEAQKPVHFEVEAYRGEVFTSGTIEQIRLSAQQEQNVVSYPVIVATPNPELKLLPGMTASLTFHVSEKRDVIKVPKKALAFYPSKKEHVHEDDHDKLNLSILAAKEDEDEAEDEDDEDNVQEGTRRHVWIRDGDLLRAVEIRTGVGDVTHAEMLSGDLKVGDEVVTEVMTKRSGF